MPHYYFHIRNGLGFTEDEEGRDLASLDDALAAAVEGARSLLSAEVAEGDLDLRGCIEVTDAEGKLLRSIDFGDVVAIKTGPIPGSEARRGEMADDR